MTLNSFLSKFSYNIKHDVYSFSPKQVEVEDVVLDHRVFLICTFTDLWKIQGTQHLAASGFTGQMIKNLEWDSFEVVKLEILHLPV